MAKVRTIHFYNQPRAATHNYKIIPIGDIHIGAAAADEKLLQSIVRYIEETPDCYWIGMGDYADFINMSDPRFSAANLAKWVDISDLDDLAEAQKDRVVDMLRPIAGKCLAMLAGNHETAIQRHYEHNIYWKIVKEINEAAGIESGDSLAMGYYGWLIIKHYGSEENEKKRTVSTITINLHHGFTGGKLAGGKALNMQRWLWTHECDLVLMGHSHNTSTQKEAVEHVDRTGRIRNHVRHGAFTGTFLQTVNDAGASTYSEVKGYMPLPIGGVEVLVYPYASDHRKIRIFS